MANNKDFILANPVEAPSIKGAVGTITSSDLDLSTGNYFSDTLNDYTTYTFSNAGDVQTFQLEVVGSRVPYDLSALSYDNKSFDMSSQDSGPFDVHFKTDGTAFYMVGTTGDKIYQYTVSTAWDVSTASYSGKQVSVSTEETTPRGLFIKSDGTKAYIVGSTSDRVYQYSLSTAWDISTASYDSKNFLVSSQETIPEAVSFKTDGTKMYITGSSSDSVYQYSLSTAWDVSTASYDSVSLAVNTEETTVQGLDFSSDGTKMFVSGSSSDTIHPYTLSTAWDLSTATYDGSGYAIIREGSHNGIHFADGGTRLYLTDADDIVNQYSTGLHSITWPSSVSWLNNTPSSPDAGTKDIFTFTTNDGGTTYIGSKSASKLS